MPPGRTAAGFCASSQPSAPVASGSPAGDRCGRRRVRRLRLNRARQSYCSGRKAEAAPSPCMSDAISQTDVHRVGALPLDDVVHLEHFRVAWVDPQLGQDRPQTLTKRFKLLLRIPDLTDLEVPLRAKAELVVESVGGKDPGLIEATDDFVVLLCPQGRRRETDYQAHERAPYSGVATLTFARTSRERYCCFSSKAALGTGTPRSTNHRALRSSSVVGGA